MSLLSKKNKEILTGPLNINNPIIVQILGVCSALAVTAKLQPAFVMALSVTIITAVSCFAISLLRKTIPPRIRIIVQLIIVSAIVIVVNEFLKAYMYDISKQLSIFVGLIITNCMLIGRLEAFAFHNKPIPSFLDGLGSGMGYGLILIVMGVVRELLGSGTLWGYQIVPDWCYEHGYMNNGFVILPPMALILVGVIIWIHRSRNKTLQEK